MNRLQNDNSYNFNPYISIIDNDLIFTVQKYDKTLISLESMNEEERDIVIPSMLPSGHQIIYLCRGFLRGKYNKITISNGIKVLGGAFERSLIKEVAWPDDCYEIPYECFNESTLERITNINNVRIIENYAFKSTNLSEIVWPTLCERIPKGCFISSKLTTMNNINNVKEIGMGAFLGTYLFSLDLSNTNVSYLEENSLLGLSMGSSIPPYYIPKEDWNKAF